MAAILNGLLEITIYSAILYGTILVFQKVFHKHISAALNFAVWMLLVLRLLMPVTINSGLYLFVMPEQTAAQTVQTNPSASWGLSIQRPESSRPSQPGTPPSSSEASANESVPEPARKDQQPTGRAFDWQTALVLLWGAGMLGSAAFLLACHQWLGRRTKRYGTAAPEHVTKLVEQLKAELEIKADILVSINGWLKSPALSSSIRPRLLLPLYMLDSMNAGQLEFGILHELTHYKRRDHLVNILMLTLRCVYWFNPFVHLAFRRMQIDMETACDANVTARLNAPECTRYIETMIDMGGNGSMQYMLGMGMSKGRRAMEKRVRGIFMKKRTRMPVRMATGMLAGLMLVVCFTTACQPTPENPVVVGKGEGLPSQALNAETSGNPLADVPEKWSDEMDLSDSVKITIDADIELPPAKIFPVHRLQRQELTQERLNELIDYFAPSAQLYAHDVFTREYYEQRLIEAKRGTLVDGQYIPPAADDPWVKSIEEQLANAPLSSEVTPASTEFDYYSDYDGHVDKSRGENFLDVRFTTSAGKMGSIFAMRYEKGDTIDNRFDFGTGINVIEQSIMESQSKIAEDQRQYHTDEELAANDKNLQLLESGFFDHFTLTQDEAIAQADRVISDLGIDSMGIVGAEKALIKRYSGMAGFSDVVAQDPGYILTYARNLGAIAGYFSNSMTNPDGQGIDEGTYAPPFAMETISIVITDNGVEAFNWYGMAQKAETVSENTDLLPFEQIEERILSQLKYQFMPSEDTGDITNTEIIIDRVRLVSGYINVRDDLSSVWHIPVWVAQGRIVYFKNDEKEMESNLEGLMINALDGGLVYGQDGSIFSGG